ncbi:Uma2 family endonuclease [Calothrix sp. 336/3]|uniref:Uma2 family endonuclease n=1 Tax=Calothrix sp. 336/3 TaxID=1337936 RepID=UPI0006249D6F|nr:Uma2 family endonuclease [Calothrix sp. 336/3]AKG24834.1 hypothetical protein IJ00_25130 [Calothrix sp. 336/3]
MVQISEKIYSPIEYLELEINSELRHEYIQGKIREMTGGTPNHNQIALNVSSTLNFALKRQPYRVFVTDQRLWIPEENIYTYPDVMVISEPLELQPGRTDTVINPLMITEVLSKSTRSYDVDEKFSAYRTIPSFQEYVLIDQYKVHVSHFYKKENNQWIFSEYIDKNQVLPLAFIPL